MQRRTFLNSAGALGAAAILGQPSSPAKAETPLALSFETPLALACYSFGDTPELYADHRFEGTLYLHLPAGSVVRDCSFGPGSKIRFGDNVGTVEHCWIELASEQVGIATDEQGFLRAAKAGFLSVRDCHFVGGAAGLCIPAADVNDTRLDVWGCVFDG